MTQSEVIKAGKAAPLKRTQASLVYRDKEFGIPAQVLFEFTDGKLDDISYGGRFAGAKSRAGFSDLVPRTDQALWPRRGLS